MEKKLNYVFNLILNSIFNLVGCYVADFPVKYNTNTIQNRLFKQIRP